MKNFLIVTIPFSLLLSVLFCQSQDRNYIVNQDSSASVEVAEPGISSNSFPYIYHFPSKYIQQLYESHAYLKDIKPTIENYSQYFILGYTLWHLNKIEAAEKIFLTIEDSGKSGTDFFSDTAVNNLRSLRYSFPGYKYNACIYLAKIYIEKNEFAKALAFLDKAMNKYRIEYGCVINREYQKKEYLSLYSTCCKELNLNKKYIDVALPEFIIWHDDFLIKAIKEMYTFQQIAGYLVQAGNSIVYTIDSLPSVYYSGTDDSKGNVKRDTIICYPSSATINLFNSKSVLYHEFKSVENKEEIRKYYLHLFEESEFYKSLCKEEWIVKAN